jgi:hypothetical protein
MTSMFENPRSLRISGAAVLTTGVAAMLLLAPGVVYGQNWQTMSNARKYSNETAMKVDVGYAAGKLNISPASEGSLFRANLKYDADIFKHPVLAYSNGTLKVDMSEGSVKGRNMKAGRLDLELGTRAPIDLDLSFGAAEATVDLSGMPIRRAAFHTGASQTKLTISKLNPIVCEEIKLEVGAAEFQAIGLGNLNADRINVSGGVGSVTLDFSGSSKRDITSHIEMGLGELILRVPRGMAVKVTKQGLLASFDSEGLVKRGDAFFSENWKTASRHLTLDIDAAFGSIEVKWID